MKAQLLREYGNTSHFYTGEVPKPTIKPGHVLIQVAANSVNPADIGRMTYGALSSIPGTEPPVILGMDVSGTVVEVGDGADFSVGDAVYGCAGGVRSLPGALAEFMLADARLVAHTPKNLSLREAAALPLVAITAWEALVDRAQLQKGQTVLVYGGTGGVGHVAIQLAKARGAEVFTTVSTQAKAETARSLGADHVIMSLNQSVEEFIKTHTKEGVDVVLDLADCFQEAISVLKRRGALANVGGADCVDLSDLQVKELSIHGVRMLAPMIYNQGREHHHFILNQITQLVEAGRLRPLLDEAHFSLEQAGEAYDYLRQKRALRTVTGKIIIDVC